MAIGYDRYPVMDSLSLLGYQGHTKYLHSKNYFIMAPRPKKLQIMTLVINIFIFKNTIQYHTALFFYFRYNNVYWIKCVKANTYGIITRHISTYGSEHR